MLAAQIFIALLVAPVVSEQACASQAKDLAVDDVTSLLQNQVDLRAGTSRTKPATGKAEEAKTDPGQGAKPSAFSALEQKQWLGKTGMLTKGLAEFVAMTLFVFVGCGTAMAVPDQGGKLFQVSLTFGFAITSLAYAIGHYSGGQINPAVSFGLVCSGNLSVLQALVNVAFQLLGAKLGSFITHVIFSSDKTDHTKGIGTNAVSPDFTASQALIGEIVGTFILVYVVHETAINPATSGHAQRAMACLAIGLAVFLAHCVLIPVDGCSINPARSFGPMVIRKSLREDPSKPSDGKYISDHWIFWVGPLVGAGLAALVYMGMQHV